MHEMRHDLPTRGSSVKVTRDSPLVFSQYVEEEGRADVEQYVEQMGKKLGQSGEQIPRPRQVLSPQGWVASKACPQGWAASKACPPDAIHVLCLLDAKFAFVVFLILLVTYREVLWGQCCPGLNRHPCPDAHS